MGRGPDSLLGHEIDEWLHQGGVVVASSERAARSLASAFHHARRAESLTAWPTPRIHDWRSFVKAEWQQRNQDGRFVLNPLQEKALWAKVLRQKNDRSLLLDGPRDRLAAMAMDAHDLLCSYAPRYLDVRARVGWSQDSGACSEWLADFDSACKSNGAVAASRLPLELIQLLLQDTSQRSPLLLVGFDRQTPAQRDLFRAWRPASVREVAAASSIAAADYRKAADSRGELAACVRWCSEKLAANPDSSILVVSQDIAQRRGEIERAFLRMNGPGSESQNTPAQFEFSLGAPLASIPVARSALLLLDWLSTPLEENKLDWLISIEHGAASAQESQALAQLMRELRRRGMQRTQWPLDNFAQQQRGNLIPSSWADRMFEAQRQLETAIRAAQSPFYWAELVPRLLRTMGWPGFRQQTSIEFQAAQRWQRVLDECASLGFDGKPIPWHDFFAALKNAAHESLFAPESLGAPVLIAGPAETAGLTADAVWFLGASEEQWPPRGTMNPLLPVAVQREAAMPHSSPQADLDAASVIVQRLLASAPEVRFSYAGQIDGVDTRPSRLIVKAAGEELTLSAGQQLSPETPLLTEIFVDNTTVPFPIGAKAGGANVLTAQSQCPFRAFATARLGAESWDPAEAGLTPAERGTLLHAVMHAIWAGKPDGVRNHSELHALRDLPDFVATHVHRVFQQKLPPRAREAMPARYLQLEETRLQSLVCEWLSYEQARVPFTVRQTEVTTDAMIGSLALRVRLDRVDQLRDGSLLVVDYKSGDVSPKSWDPPRPDDVQLPLYAGYAVDRVMGDVGGLVFAKIRAADCAFDGRLADARGQLNSGLSTAANLVKKPLRPDDLAAWRTAIETLAHDFVTGRAEVSPREYPKTCERCGLQTLCRIEETRALGREDAEEDGASNE